MMKKKTIKSKSKRTMMSIKTKIKRLFDNFKSVGWIVRFVIVFCLWNSSPKVTAFDLKFPENFIFGAATSAYQTEGAWNVSGKGKSIWDEYTHTKLEQNGDDAAKSYYLYKNDSDLLRDIGFDMYRISISWPRILPNGDLTVINREGIQHYNDVINDLLEKKIEPMVTMYHWDLPQKLQDTGGWLNASTVDHMLQYADLLFYHYGDRVKWWITINEPSIVVQGYCTPEPVLAPALGLGSPCDYTVTHNLLLSHMRIYRLYEKKYKTQQGRISISLVYTGCLPKTQSSQEDLDAIEKYFQFALGIFAHPIYSNEGDYPKLVRDTVYNNSIAEGATNSRLPQFTEEEKSSLRGSSDFFSFNYYTSFLCSLTNPNESQNNRRMIYKDNDIKMERNFSRPLMEGWSIEVSPNGFREVLKKISKEYNNPKIFVTENGYADWGRTTHDTSRVEYHRDHLTELLNARNYDNCTVIGYIFWSLLDNFEWFRGYGPKFGLVAVDFNSTSRKRTRKTSSFVLETFLKSRRKNTVEKTPSF